MKKIIAILFFLLSLEGVSQDYNFDHFYEYKTDNGSRFIMINSQNDGYVFIGYPLNDEIHGYIYDYNKNEFHYFDVRNSNNEVVFTYSSSRKVKNCYCFDSEKRIVYEVTNEPSKVIVKKSKLKKNGKKIERGELEFDYDATISANLDAKHLRFYMHNLFNGFDFSSLGNKLPFKIIHTNDEGKKFTSSLIKNKKILTLLSISKEQLNYK